MKLNQGMGISPLAIFAYITLAALILFTPKNQAQAQATYPSLPTSSTLTATLNPSTDIKLNVPYFQQQYLNSCESSALRMALGFYGIQTDDMQVLQKIGYNPRTKDLVKNEWDDPQQQFVGFVDTPNGYGVYGLPVAYATQAFGRRAEYRVYITAQFLAKEITAGHPIVVWGSTSVSAPAYTWNLPNGGKARAFRGEHARVVVGLKGSVLDPTGFYLHDPQNGQQFQYWTTADLMKNIYSVPGVTNQAVVVR
jgi:uncharacterized protein YvpB